MLIKKYQNTIMNKSVYAYTFINDMYTVTNQRHKEGEKISSFILLFQHMNLY